jgi:hypothetical protein
LQKLGGNVGSALFICPSAAADGVPNLSGLPTDLEYSAAARL